MSRRRPTCPLWPLLLLGVLGTLGQSPSAVAGSNTSAEMEPAEARPDAGLAAGPANQKPSLPKPPPRARPSRSEVQALIAEVSRELGVERELVAAVVAAESNYNAHAVSPVGAVGLMQVMPATAADYGVSSNAALFDPKTNLRTGTRHLKRLLSKYRNDYGRVIMAYNAGEGVIDRTGTNVTYQETLAYTEAVISHYRRNGGTQPTQDALIKVRSFRGVRNLGKARRLLKKYLDPSLLSLKVQPTLSLRLLNPALHAVGPESKPMFELDNADIR